MVNENNQIIIYQTEDGQTQVDVRMENDTVWLPQAQMADLFGKDRTVITRHINNVFKEGELNQKEVCAKIAHTTRHGAMDGKTQVQEVFFTTSTSSSPCDGEGGVNLINQRNE